MCPAVSSFSLTAQRREQAVLIQTQVPSKRNNIPYPLLSLGPDPRLVPCIRRVLCLRTPISPQLQQHDIFNRFRRFLVPRLRAPVRSWRSRCPRCRAAQPKTRDTAVRGTEPRHHTCKEGFEYWHTATHDADVNLHGAGSKLAGAQRGKGRWRRASR